MPLDQEQLEEFGDGIATARIIARRIAEFCGEEYPDAKEWEFLAGLLTLAGFLSAEVNPAALKLAMLVAQDSVEELDITPKIGLIDAPTGD